jgi:hypothetical protein
MGGDLDPGLADGPAWAVSRSVAHGKTTSLDRCRERVGAYQAREPPPDTIQMSPEWHPDVVDQPRGERARDDGFG